LDRFSDAWKVRYLERVFFPWLLIARRIFCFIFSCNIYITSNSTISCFQFFSRIRWKFPVLGFPSNGSTSGGGSFRSRQSTMSSATTTELGGEHSGSMTSEKTEIQNREAEDVESLMAPYRLRRSRTRWTDDYGQENELDSNEVSNLTLKCKPYRGQCFIRCSPEKIGPNALWSHQCQDIISDRQASWFPPQNDSCERCWHNPETPFCDICLTDNSHSAEIRPGTIFVRAVVENPPKLPVWFSCHEMILSFNYINFEF
jgi:hypothetical protein